MKGTDGILIATLGTKAQVVTTALDLLLAQGHPLRDVVVLYPGGADPAEGGPLAPALARLRAEFSVYPAYRFINLILSPLTAHNGPVVDIASQAEAEAAFRCLYRAIWTAKRAEPDRTVHLSIVGGRKVLAVYGMAAAQLLFDDDDCLWYVFADGRFLQEERLHPDPADLATLVPVPVLRWGTVSPILMDLGDIDDPFQAADRQRHMQLQERLAEARSFVLGSLTAAERRVVELLVREGLTDADIGGRLNLSPRTVERHLGDAYRKAAAHWGLTGATRAQLVVLLNLYFTLHLQAMT